MVQEGTQYLTLTSSALDQLRQLIGKQGDPDLELGADPAPGGTGRFVQ